MYKCCKLRPCDRKTLISEKKNSIKALIRVYMAFEKLVQVQHQTLRASLKAASAQMYFNICIPQMNVKYVA